MLTHEGRLFKSGIGDVDYEAFLLENDRPARVKRELPVAFVLEKLADCQLHVHGSRAVTQCPMHQDSSPSLEVWNVGGWQKWGCWPCGKSGDVIDLLRALWPSLSFGAALTMGERAIDALRSSGWTGPTLQPGVAWDSPRYKALLDTGTDHTPVNALVASRGWNFSAEYLRTKYWVGGRNGEVLIPYYSRDLELVGMKHRRGTGLDKPYAFPGSKLLGNFYGDHLLRSAGPILLCEGESDCWTASWVLRDTPFSVLGLPAGAGSLPFRVEEFAGREVHICFDGDDAGRTGAAVWSRALTADGALHVDLHVWALGEGLDLTTVGGPTWLLG